MSYILFASVDQIYYAQVTQAILDPLDTSKRVSMGLTDRRKTAKNLVDSRKN